MTTHGLLSLQCREACSPRPGRLRILRTHRGVEAGRDRRDMVSLPKRLRCRPGEVPLSGGVQGHNFRDQAGGPRVPLGPLGRFVGLHQGSGRQVPAAGVLYARERHAPQGSLELPRGSPPDEAEDRSEVVRYQRGASPVRDEALVRYKPLLGEPGTSRPSCASGRSASCWASSSSHWVLLHRLLLLVPTTANTSAAGCLRQSTLKHGSAIRPRMHESLSD
mmetsp:Transcript_160030/g.513450  ORF Transcript_160030/g.513450 Transcript_160030/m.513450 type:complete len:220 (-) Transcript_160030:687-1346(-)